MTLKIAPGLSLPLDVVTQTIAILAKRRAGKSYTMRRLIEQLFKAGQQVVLIDPKGDQWGLRSAANGKGPGLPVVILGGERGDLKLEVGSGEVVARLVVEERVSVLLDLSPFRKHEVATFMTAFMENIYRLKAKEIYRTPMMLVIDEADAIAPQKPQKGEERMLGAAEDIVRRGGQRGIGCVLVTQRSAVLNKNVLTQAQVLVVLRTIAPQDLAAMKAWIDVHGDEAQGQEMLDSLPSLPIGDAWFWSPGWPTPEGIFKRVHVLPIETFDSGKSPEPGVDPVEPKHLADVDLGALQRQMADTIEKAKADDPRLLKKRVAQLEQELSKRQTPATVEKRVDVLTAADRDVLQHLSTHFADIASQLKEQGTQRIDRVGAKVKQEIDAAVRSTRDELDAHTDMVVAKLEGVGVAKILAKLAAVSEPTARLVPVGPRPAARRDVIAEAIAADGVSKAEQRILNAVAWWRGAAIGNPSRQQVAFVAGYTVNGHFNNLVGGLRSKGLIDYPTAGGICLSLSGVSIAQFSDDAPTREALIAKVLSVLDGAPGRIFKAVADAGLMITRDDLAQRTGYTVNGHFNNLLGGLRSLGVIDYPHGGTVALGAMFDVFGVVSR